MDGKHDKVRRGRVVTEMIEQFDISPETSLLEQKSYTYLKRISNIL
ncbi:MAG: hypothetical protein OER22_00300 [Gammaproteobacteria bacterium]|nr:hypothetical protein [Gammaproteobacteria bacterium]MDH3409206.1 hypothetical protein [Gammaproteobacteria bacterium]MDH3551034.1 hypothetical protein [Gammaproteobacteria bacterium]